MHRYFSDTKFKITLCITLSLLMGIFVAAVSDSGSSPFSSALSVVMTPLQTLASEIAEKLDSFEAKFVSSGVYEQEIESLKQELDEYKALLVDYEKLKQKTEAYESFLEVKEENPDFTFVSANVIMRDNSDIYGSFTLNKGTSDSVQKNNPVIYGKYLIGVVKEVTQNSCTVYTLFNPSVNVSSYEIRTREDCIIEAQTDFSKQGLLKLTGLSRSTPIVSGGIVCTSGIGGIYPRDLIVGSVKEIIDEETDISVYATIQPAIDYSSLSDVFIITDFDGKGE